MLDPFSALGLASNIIQFIEFGGKLVSKSAEVYNSAAGSATEQQDIELAARHLRKLCEDLVRTGRAGENWSEDEKALRQLAHSCASSAHELIAILHTLKVEIGTKGVQRRMQSLRLALRSMGQESRIEAFERKLDYFRSELTLHLVILTK